MPFEQCSHPFKRLLIDHYIRGATRVDWIIQPEFNDPSPHVYQLQAGRTASNDSNDWVDVGPPVEDAAVLFDDEQRLLGKRLITHYRVKLTTPVAVYLSPPEPVYGELNARDWRLGREIIRKESLRHRYASRDGFVLKRRRFGVRCDLCRDFLTDEIIDSDCPECHGTGFEVGYHVPVAQVFDLDPETITEDRSYNDGRGNKRDDVISARVLGCFQLNKYDSWVDAKSDQRWIIHQIRHKAEMKGFPLVMQVELRLAPYTHAVYSVEVGGEPAELPGPTLPSTGTGSVSVDHDYGGTDNLAYMTADGAGVQGAVIRAFTKADCDAGNFGSDFVVAQTTTVANGRWARAMLLDPGEYCLQYFKTGEFSPTLVDLTVTTTEVSSISSEVSASAPSQSSSSQSQSSSSSFWSI